jgi:hypothetical protein
MRRSPIVVAAKTEKLEEEGPAADIAWIVPQFAA